ncbi:MAG: bifunctional 5,10-methylenetetrahydrofolate dehydrogenase/5,10-methenyltetrahydrofolate cyclohydrolase [Candidatus Omnitrophota bacterium]
MAQLLYGKDRANEIKAETAAAIKQLEQKYQLRPTLCAIQVGENLESAHYLESQRKVAEKLSVDHIVKQLPGDVSQKQLIELIKNLNNDPEVNGIILQMPLPEHLDVTCVRGYIRSNKDVEGVHPKNLGNVLLGKWDIAPCTACAVMELLAAAKVDLYGKETVVIGHSQIVGRPLSVMLMQHFATVTVCHIATAEAGQLNGHINKADILIVAVGKAEMVRGESIKEGAVVIDVGINSVDGKLVGDVEFAAACEKASIITPVPGGVGPLTVAVLMRNLVHATELQLK